MKKNNKGFTLAELLIVVAIIAVLVAIAIPVFTSQLEKSREATDMANLRSGYAGVMTAYLGDGSATAVTVAATQRNFGEWEAATNATIGTQISGYADSISVTAPSKADGWTVSADDAGSITITPIS